MNQSPQSPRETEPTPYPRQKITWLATITSLWRHLSLATETREVYRAATTVLAKAFQAEKCAILRYDETRQELVCETPAYGLDAAAIEQIRISVKEGSISRLLWEREESLAIDDIRFEPHFKPCVDLARALGVRSLLTSNLRTDDRCLGTVVLANKRSGQPFNPTDAALLRVVAEQIAIALVNAQTLKAQAREAKRGRTLNEIANLLHSTLDQREIMKVMATMTMMAVRADRCHVFVMREMGAPPRPGLSITRIEEGQQWRISETVDEARARWFAAQWSSFDRARPTIIEDVFFSPIIPSSWTTQLDIKTLVLAPLLAKDLLWGYLMLEYSGQIHQLEEDEVGLLEDITSQSALALSNAQAFQAVQNEVESLRESANVYAPLVEGAGAAILVVQEGRYRYASGGIGELLGYTPEELGEMYLLDIFDPQSQSSVIDSYERTLEGKRVPSFRTQAVAKDGRRATLNLAASLIEHGGAPAVEFIASDTTELQWHQDRHLIDNKLEALTRLIGNLVGEARNALTPVLGFAELTLALPELSAEIRSNVQTIADGAERAKKTFDRLATWAQFRSPEKMEVNISHLLGQILSLRRYELQGYQIAVELDVEKELPKIQADPQQLQMAFLALMDNAKDALMEVTEERQLVIRARRKLPTFWRAAEVIEISFQDNGAGIAPENLTRVFDPFFSTKPPTLALGLGLWVCYQIIHNHQGGVHARSRQGEGATFIITLPILPTPESSNV